MGLGLVASCVQPGRASSHRRLGELDGRHGLVACLLAGRVGTAAAGGGGTERGRVKLERCDPVSDWL